MCLWTKRCGVLCELQLILQAFVKGYLTRLLGMYVLYHEPFPKHATGSDFQLNRWDLCSKRQGHRKIAILHQLCVCHIALYFRLAPFNELVLFKHPSHRFYWC